METFGFGRCGVRDQRPAAVEKSAAGEAGGGRRHTFGLRRPGAKLKTCAVYQRGDIVLSQGKPIPRNGNGEGQG